MRANKKNLTNLFLPLIAVTSILFVVGLQMRTPQENAPVSIQSKIFNTTAIDIFSNETTIQNPFNFKIIRQPVFPETVCDISNYGAIGDGITKNTLAFKNAITDCFQKGGGQILVPEGKWLTGPIVLQDNINLHLEKNAEIDFSTDLNDYLPAVKSRYDGVEYYNYSPLIYAHGRTNIAITGEGVINGMGQEFWWKNFSNKGETKLFQMGANGTPLSQRNFNNNQDGLRPSFIEFNNCKNILIENVTIKNSPRWTIHPLYSKDIIIRSVMISTSPGQNTDGIAIDSSQNVLIEDSYVASGDDAITIKSGRDRDGLQINKPSENVVIRNCQVQDGHGGVTIGSEVSGGIRNILIYNINVFRTDFGFRIKSSIGRGGSVENVTVQNMQIKKTTKGAAQITQDYDAQFDPSNAQETKIKNISVSNLNSGQSGYSIEIIGLPDNFIDTVTLKNIRVQSKNGLRILNTSNIFASNVRISNLNNFLAPKISNSQNIQFEKLPCSPKQPTCLEIFGENTNGITITDSAFTLRKILFQENSQPSAVTIN